METLPRGQSAGISWSPPTASGSAPAQQQESAADRLGLPRNAAPVPKDADQPASFWTVAGAAWSKTQVEQDSWGYADRTKRELADDIFRRLPKARQDSLRLTFNSRVWADEADAWAQTVLQAAHEEKDANPAADWSDLPADMPEFDERVAGLRTTELREAQDILDLPGGGFAEFLGSSARTMTDEINVALMPFGVGAGGFARMVLAEAGLGGLAEAASLPRENRVAEELDLPRPDPVTRIATGAVLSGAFAAGIGGAARFAAHMLGKRAATRLSGDGAIPPAEHEAAVRAAEDDLAEKPASSGRLATDDVAVPPRPATAARDRGANPADVLVPQLLDFVGDLEAPKGYDQVYGGSRLAPPKPITTMTIDEVLDWQAASVSAGSASSAAGRFQIIRSTLTSLKDELGLAGTEVFDAAMQRRLATVLMQRRGLNEFLEGKISIETFANSLAQEWAALPVVSGPKAGRSFYAGDGLNGALTDVPTFTRVLSENGAYKSVFSGGDGFTPSYNTRTSAAYTGEGQLRVGDWGHVDVEYRVVDAGDLRQASGRFQPRDRSQINSTEWVSDTAAKLDPAQLMPSPNAATGAPLVGPDMMIESGNGRVRAIVEAYQRFPDRGAAYRAEIERVTGQAVPEGIQQPVLVAMRRSELSDEARVDMTVAAQDSGVAQMTPVEIANVTAREITSERLGSLNPTVGVADPANKPFLLSILGALPKAVRNGMFKDGVLNADGSRMIKRALFARAWSAPDIVARYVDLEDDGDFRTLMLALEKAAPDWAVLRGEIEAGRVRPDADISPFVLDAMRMIAKARDEAASGGATDEILRGLLNDMDMLEGAVSPLTIALVERKLWRNGRAAPADEVADFLRRYAVEARKVASTSDMFPAPLSEVLRKIDPVVFGALPDDLGAPRTVMMRGMPQGAEAPVLAEGAYMSGADSAEAMEADRLVADGLRQSGGRIDAPDLLRIVEDGGSADEIAAHPAVRAVLEEANARQRTDHLPGYGTEEFWAGREYHANGKKIIGKDAAVSYLYDEARRIAWSADGLSPPDAIRSERRAVILLGPPAAGKSSIANPYARALGAAIIDPDEAKRLIPGYDGGLGASAVHEESAELADTVAEIAAANGDNLVIPKVGGTAGSIEAKIAALREVGYRVEVVLVDLEPAETWRRMIGRFLQTGRIIPPDVMQKGIDGAPRTYEILKAKGSADGYAKIDNSPGLGQPRSIVEDDGGIVPADLSEPVDARGNGGVGRAPSQDLRGESVGTQGSQGKPAGLTAAPADPSPGAGPDVGAADLVAARREYAGLTIRLEDGTEITSAQLLADIDGDVELGEVLRLCGMGSAT